MYQIHTLLLPHFCSVVLWISIVAPPLLGIMVDKLGFNLFFCESDAESIVRT